MRYSSNPLHASVTLHADGLPLSEHDLEADQRTGVTACWVSTMPGQRLALHYSLYGFSQQVVFELRVDGMVRKLVKTSCSGTAEGLISKAYTRTPGGGCVIQEADMTIATLRLGMPAHVPKRPNVGTVALLMWVDGGRPGQTRAFGAPCFLDDVHPPTESFWSGEKVKGCHSQTVAFTSKKSLDRSATSTAKGWTQTFRPGNAPWAVFQFRYDHPNVLNHQPAAPRQAVTNASSRLTGPLATSVSYFQDSHGRDMTDRVQKTNYNDADALQEWAEGSIYVPTGRRFPVHPQPRIGMSSVSSIDILDIQNLPNTSQTPVARSHTMDGNAQSQLFDMFREKPFETEAGQPARYRGSEQSGSSSCRELVRFWDHRRGQAVQRLSGPATLEATSHHRLKNSQRRFDIIRRLDDLAREQDLLMDEYTECFLGDNSRKRKIANGEPPAQGAHSPQWL